MGICKICLDKWDASPIIRRTDRISLPCFVARNFIKPYQGRAAPAVVPWVRRVLFCIGKMS